MLPPNEIKKDIVSKDLEDYEEFKKTSEQKDPQELIGKLYFFLKQKLNLFIELQKESNSQLGKINLLLEESVKLNEEISERFSGLSKEFSQDYRLSEDPEFLTSLEPHYQSPVFISKLEKYEEYEMLALIQKLKEKKERTEELTKENIILKDRIQQTDKVIEEIQDKINFLSKE